MSDISIEDAIRFVMHREGCTEDEAVELIKAWLAAGKVGATWLSPATGKREPVKREQWKLPPEKS
jgi:hypothetical protein